MNYAIVARGATLLALLAAMLAACKGGGTGVRSAPPSDGGTANDASGEASAFQRKEEKNMDSTIDRSREAITSWMEVLGRVRADEYAPFVNFQQLSDGAHVEADSRRWSARFFSRAANPYEAGVSVTRSVHMSTPTTFDILRHQYSTMGLDLVVLETVNFMVIIVERGAVDLLTGSRNDQITRIDRTAGQVLAMRGTFLGENFEEQAYEWMFRYPPTIVDGARFSTDIGKDVSWMWSWANRVDGGILNNRLFFMLFKKHEPTDGRIIFLDPRHWFDGKCWAPYTNIKPRSSR
ncbi:MAG: hypothetical protein U0359_31970 [Byssovorax sp.]